MAHAIRIRVAAVLCTLAVGCTPEALGQSDDVRPKIAAACRTEDGCRELRLEAQRGAATCQPNTLGYERCTDVNADVQEIESRLAEFEQRRVHEAAAARRAEVAWQAEAAAEELRQREAQRWLQSALADCRVRASDDGCRGAGDAIDDDTKTVCLAQCKEIMASAVDKAVERALSACVTRVVDSHGTEPPDCPSAGYAGGFGRAPAIPDERRLACATGCRDEAAKILALQIAAPRPAATTRAATTRGSTSGVSTEAGGGMAKCCDGVTSPTCECPGHRGCCSHHGGVCGCTN